MDANAWSLVEDENVTDGANDKQTEKEKRKSSSAVAPSRSASTAGRVGAGPEILAEDVEETRSENARGQSLENDLLRTERRKKSRSKSPAVESLRRFGQLVLGKMKRKRSNPLMVMSPAEELRPCPLQVFCRRPKEFFRREQPPRDAPQRRVISGQLLDQDGRRMNRELARERCAHLFRREDQSHLADALSGAEVPMRIHLYDPYCPVHGSRRRLRHTGKTSGGHRLVDMNSIFASVDTAAEGEEDEKLNPYLQSQTILAKQFRKERRALLRELEGPRLKEMKKGILTDLGIISLAFLLLFTGFNGLQILQTSVNDQLGADSLCVLYASMAISSLFVPPFVLNRVGCKRTLVHAIGLHSLYFCANLIPRYYSLIPASILAGISASCLWAANCAYITESAAKYAKMNVESTGVVIPRFFGYFFMLYHMGQVLGNLFSSLILGSAMPRLSAEDRVDYTCGHNFLGSDLSERARTNLSAPPRLAFMAVVGMALLCSLLALLTVKMFLNPLQKQTMPPKAGSEEGQAGQQTKQQFSADIFRLSLSNLRRPKPLLLIPLTVFNGIEQAFAVGLYTKAYVGCALGISEIGFVMTSFGVSDAICSLVFGPLIKLFGRMPLLMFGAVINVLMIVTLMIWAVNPGDRVLFNAVAGVWGMADGVWNTQLNGFWVAMFGPGRDQLEVAFANYRFWMSFGLALGFLLIRSTSIDNFLLVSFSFLLMGILGYFMVELYDIVADRLRPDNNEDADEEEGGSVQGQLPLAAQQVQQRQRKEGRAEDGRGNEK